MQIKLGGVSIPNHPPHNLCENGWCANQAHTAVWGNGRNQMSLYMRSVSKEN